MTESLVPVRELPPRPLTVTGCTAAKVARDAIVLALQLTDSDSCLRWKMEIGRAGIFGVLIFCMDLSLPRG